MGLEEEVDALIKQGFEDLEQGRFQRAIEIGRSLLERRHTSGFELIALAHHGAGDWDKAVQTLEKGTKAAPTV